MYLKLAKRIAKLQGINLRLLAVVKCPYCECKRVRIDLRSGRWECNCGKVGREEELLRLVEDDYLDKHSQSQWELRNNKGVS